MTVDDVGRIAGFNSGGNDKCCYATGKVSGKGFVGGIVGYNYQNIVTDCIALNPGIARTDNCWVFDAAATWTYLPWNPAFASFPGISAADYCISVPQHLNGGGTVN